MTLTLRDVGDIVQRFDLSRSEHAVLVRLVVNTGSEITSADRAALKPILEKMFAAAVARNRPDSS